MTRARFTIVVALLASLASVSVGHRGFAQSTAATNATAPQASTPLPVEPAITPDLPQAPAIPTVPHELSPLSMFLAADIVVKSIMVGLAFASVVTWTIFLAKSLELFVIRRKLTAALRRVSDARSLADANVALSGQSTVLTVLIGSAVHEVQLSSDLAYSEGMKDRAASRFADVTRAESRIVRRGMGLLATIGSTAPFVGLFGTVWGIMNSFIGISKSQTTNLAVVAPGIAEALLATALGLVAAIPAVILYNHFARGTKAYLDLVSNAVGMAGRLLSRDLDRRSATPIARAAE